MGLTCCDRPAPAAAATSILRSSSSSMSAKSVANLHALSSLISAFLMKMASSLAACSVASAMAASFSRRDNFRCMLTSACLASASSFSTSSSLPPMAVSTAAVTLFWVWTIRLGA